MLCFYRLLGFDASTVRRVVRFRLAAIFHCKESIGAVWICLRITATSIETERRAQGVFQMPVEVGGEERLAAGS